jgi:hypothetical protein
MQIEVPSGSGLGNDDRLGYANNILYFTACHEIDFNH